MNYVEEQSNELEALGEIYFNEIKVKSTESPVTFSINVRPQASTVEDRPSYRVGQDDDSDEYASEDDSDDDSCEPRFSSQANLSVNLLFQLPSKYPDEPPFIEITDSNCLTEGELGVIRKILNEKSKEYLGTVMVFNLVSDIVEWLSNKSDSEAYENEVEKEKQKESKRIESKRIEGTPVTMASFLAWKAKFDAEQVRARMAKQKLMAEQGVSDANRLTGREMFESDKTLAESDLNFVEDLDQSQLEALMQNLDDLDIDPDEDFAVDGESDIDDEDFSLEEESSDEEETSKQGSSKT